MFIQQVVSKELMKDKIGKEYTCLIENMTEDGEYYIGRTYMDVPSEDGVVYVKYDSAIMVNDFVNVKIVDSSEYDLIGEVVK
jgi:ribosomal protein S12 methylthiotransferase